MRSLIRGFVFCRLLCVVALFGGILGFAWYACDLWYCLLLVLMFGFGVWLFYGDVWASFIVCLE